MVLEAPKTIDSKRFKWCMTRSVAFFDPSPNTPTAAPSRRRLVLTAEKGTEMTQRSISARTVAAAGRLALLCVAIPLNAADLPPLFSQPLHLVRRISDPISASVVIVDEYCAGNLIVSVRGAQVVITDYGKQVITEIDRNAGTYSITSFEQLARSQSSKVSASSARREEWKTSSVVKRVASTGRTLDTVDASRRDVRLTVGTDPQLRLSRAAVEALIGASFPNRRAPEHDAILDAAAGGSRLRIAGSDDSYASSDYALPSEQTITWNVEGESVTMRSSVAAITADLPPADLMTIDPRWQRVESRRIRAAKELDELDRLPGREKQQ